MIPGFHGFDLVIILIIALLIFGPKKLPEMGSAIGKSIKEFRKGMNELTHKDEEETPMAISQKDMNKLGSVPAYRPDVVPTPAQSEASAPEVKAE